MRHKLVADQGFIGSATDQWVFLWQNLTPKVQSRVAAFYEAGLLTQSPHPAAFLEYLEKVFSDPHKQEMAQAELEQMRQDNRETFAAFYVRFEQKLALAGGLEWAAGVKLARLRRALSKRMRECSLGRGVPRDDYDAAVAMYRSIAVDLEAFDLEEQFRRSLPPLKAAPRDADGDTAMTGINATGSSSGGRRRKNSPPRPSARQGGKSKGPQGQAQWVSGEVIQKRKADGSCLRCGMAGHRIRDCNLRPAKPPVSVRALASSENPSDDSSEDGEGNEPPPN